MDVHPTESPRQAKVSEYFGPISYMTSWKTYLSKVRENARFTLSDISLLQAGVVISRFVHAASTQMFFQKLFKPLNLVRNSLCSSSVSCVSSKTVLQAMENLYSMEVCTIYLGGTSANEKYSKLTLSPLCFRNWHSISELGHLNYCKYNLQSKINNSMANGIDPDELACSVLFHLDLHCLQKCLYWSLRMSVKLENVFRKQYAHNYTKNNIRKHTSGHGHLQRFR